MHSFTQRFAAYLKKISETDKSSDKVLIEYYTSALGPDLAMFAKGRAKPTLTETYEEAEVVKRKEKVLRTIQNNQEKEAQEGRPYCSLSLRKKSRQIWKIWPR